MELFDPCGATHFLPLRRGFPITNLVYHKICHVKSCEVLFVFAPSSVIAFLLLPLIDPPIIIFKHYITVVGFLKSNVADYVTLPKKLLIFSASPVCEKNLAHWISQVNLFPGLPTPPRFGRRTPLLSTHTWRGSKHFS